MALPSVSVRNLVSSFLEPEEREGIRFFEHAFQKTVQHVQNTPSLANWVDRVKFMISQAGKTVVYVKDAAGRKPEKLEKVLTSGANKTAIQLTQGRVLMVPNAEDVSLEDMGEWWSRVVEEEVAMSELFDSHVLLTPRSKRVEISWGSKDEETTLPAYVCESFEHLAQEKGTFLIDMNGRGSTWKKGEEFLFASDEARLKETNWDKVFDPMLDDLARICLHDLPAGGETMNVAIVNKNHRPHRESAEDGKTAEPEYAVRYFGFDFSDKGIFKLFKPEGPVHDRALEGKAFMYMYRMIQVVFAHEFGAAAGSGDVKALFDRLLKKYPKIVMERVQKLRASKTGITD